MVVVPELADGRQAPETERGPRGERRARAIRGHGQYVFRILVLESFLRLSRNGRRAAHWLTEVVSFASGFCLAKGLRLAGTAIDNETAERTLIEERPGACHRRCRCTRRLWPCCRTAG